VAHNQLLAEQYAPVVPRLTWRPARGSRLRERDCLGKLVERMRASRLPVDVRLFASIVKAWDAGVPGRVHVPQRPARAACHVRRDEAALGRRSGPYDKCEGPAHDRTRAAWRRDGGGR
jgi:hypothetical protein